MIAALFWYYGVQREALESESSRGLSAVASVKAHQIANWRSEREGDGEVLGAPITVRVAARILSDGGSSIDRNDLLDYWRRLEHSFAYADVALIGLDGAASLDLHPDFDGPRKRAQFAAEAIASSDIYLSDLYRDPISGRILLAVVVPVQKRGAFVLDIDAEQFLFPYVEAWPTPSGTAESLLVQFRPDSVRYLTDRRSNRHQPLTQARIASAKDRDGVERLKRGEVVKDYSAGNTLVLATARPVPGSDWYLAAKISIDEVNAPLRRLPWEVGIITVLIGIVNVVGAGFIWRNQRLRTHREHQALAGHFDSLTRYANDIIVLLDEDGRIVDANERAVKVYGYALEELIGMDARSVRAPSALADFDARRASGAFEECMRYETLHRSKDGSEFHVDVSTRVIPVDGRRFKQCIIRDISERVRAEKKIKALTERLINADEEQRTRLARELHDDIGQQIAAMSIGMGNLKRQIPKEATAPREQSDRIQKKLIHLSECVRHLSHELHPSLLEYSGLPAALKSYCAEFQALTGVQVSVEADDQCDSLPRAAALCIYRISQEALQNVAKHSGAREARLALARVNGDVILEVSDTGKGFTAGATSAPSGLGLVSMKERARIVNGTLEVTSHPGAGTTLRICLPVPDAASDAAKSDAAEA
jgi:PAS domain S-box-containing protein